MVKHAQSNAYEKYDADGKTEHAKCPRCGSFVADHDNRVTCGKCGYAEIQK